MPLVSVLEQRRPSPLLRRFLRVFQFLFAPPVPALLDEPAGLVERASVAEEAAAVEEDIGLMEPHGPALRDLPGLVQVGPRGVGIALDRTHAGAEEEAAGDKLLISGSAEAVHRGGEMVGGGLGVGCWVFGVRVAKQRTVQRRAAQGEVVEGDVEKPVIALRDLNCLLRPLLDFAADLSQVRSSAFTLNRKSVP